MNVGGMKVRVKAVTGHFAEMCVLPPMCRNNRNIINIYKNIYIKHIDKQHASITASRNTLEHTGTFFEALFQKCSSNPVFLNIATALGNKGLQPISEKTCSGMFRLQGHNLRTARTQAGPGLQPASFLLFRMFRRTDGHTHLFSTNL